MYTEVAGGISPEVGRLYIFFNTGVCWNSDCELLILTCHITGISQHH